MEPIPFKFRWIDTGGRQSGFVASNGELREDELVLDKTVLPLSCIYRVVHRYNRLAVVYASETGTATCIIAPHGLDRKLKETIDRLCSYRWAEARHEQLAREGKAAAYRTAKCRACTAVVDLTGFAETPQFYCPYCESLQRSDLEVDPGMEGYRLCDKCRFYCRPTRFTAAYVVLNMVSWQEHHSCHVCIRRQCFKMLAINLLPPFIGLILAIGQTVRAYAAGELDARFPELVRANAYAQKGRVAEALTLYEQMLERTPVHAGLRYNLALGYGRAHDWEACLETAQAALGDCANYQPAGDLVAQALSKLNRSDEATRFSQAWGMPATEAKPTSAGSEQIQRQAPGERGEGIREA